MEEAPTRAYHARGGVGGPLGGETKVRGETENLARSSNETSLRSCVPWSSAHQVSYLQLPIPETSGAEAKISELGMTRG